MPEEPFAVIMAGGSGTRFWPLSRRKWPKQFLSLDRTGESLLQAAVRRLLPLIPAENIYIVTSHLHAAVTAEQLPSVPRENILAEPAGRNTAPCVGWASAHVRRRSPRGVISVFPADPRIEDEAAYLRTVTCAIDAARAGSMVTIGITPTRAETGYGYIEVGEPVSSAAGADEALTAASLFSVPDPAVLFRPPRLAIPVHRALRFVEKPDLLTAESYLAAGNFLWNSGMFFFRADVILDAIARLLPDLDAGLRNLDEAAGEGDEARAVADIYPLLPSVSLDYGVMERSDDILVVPGSFGWSDIGSWTTAWEHASKDARGNALLSDAVVVDGRNCYLRGHDPEKLIALVGVDDLVVVDTPDALLVIPRGRAQDVRLVVEQLRARGRAEDDSHL